MSQPCSNPGRERENEEEIGEEEERRNESIETKGEELGGGRVGGREREGGGRERERERERERGREKGREIERAHLARGSIRAKRPLLLTWGANSKAHVLTCVLTLGGGKGMGAALTIDCGEQPPLTPPLTAENIAPHQHSGCTQNIAPCRVHGDADGGPSCAPPSPSPITTHA